MVLSRAFMRGDPAGEDRARTEQPPVPSGPTVAIVHDYLTQRGGAERVVLEFARAFSGAPIHTSVFNPDRTYPELGELDIRVSPLDRVRVLREHHRVAFPLLAPTFSGLRVDADVVLCSSSGWAHGVHTTGRKVVYCHAPARWLYQRQRYLGLAHAGSFVQKGARARRSQECWRVRSQQLALHLLGPSLMRWDKDRAQSADRYLTNSTTMASMIGEVYGMDAEVVPPPPIMDPSGPTERVPKLDDGFLLCVARLLPYKNIRAVMSAAELVHGERLVVVGSGPLREELTRSGPQVTFLEHLGDAQLRWLYAHARALVSASYEDFGLTPLEAATFGCPSVVLRAGGFLDTVVDGETGVFFDRPEPLAIAEAIRECLDTSWSGALIQAHAAQFSAEQFRARIRRIVLEEAAA